MPPLKCLISAGPTREWIDPVRFISNPSSGKMGYALAKEARDMGFDVCLVSGPVELSKPEGVEVIEVESALSMKRAIDEKFNFYDWVIMTAAVCDHRPKSRNKIKIPKDQFPENLLMSRNPDILKELGEKKRENQVLVGFAAETHMVLESAHKKLKQKKLDWIVANDVSKTNQGFSSDQNEVTLINSDGQENQISRADKSVIAKAILHAIHLSWLEKAH
ncbi:phosphopantothenoylcysteine decarboxylase domain-containing protein [Candidatus Chordibacter forsetii]|uniref:phosphopantothenoylcysteine decarboxylase domain-containing protein n=1 Tax=Candidatus Chordibacter forsetii TaxID=3381758 RepID=UPI00389B2BCB